jgi:hypothetical protein
MLRGFLWFAGLALVVVVVVGGVGLVFVYYLLCRVWAGGWRNRKRGLLYLEPVDYGLGEGVIAGVIYDIASYYDSITTVSSSVAYFVTVADSRQQAFNQWCFGDGPGVKRGDAVGPMLS